LDDGEIPSSRVAADGDGPMDVRQSLQLHCFTLDVT